jgi:plastocyanin
VHAAGAAIGTKLGVGAPAATGRTGAEAGGDGDGDAPLEHAASASAQKPWIRRSMIPSSTGSASPGKEDGDHDPGVDGLDAARPVDKDRLSMMPPGKQRSISGLAALFLATTAVFVEAACSKPTEASAQTTTSGATIAQSSPAVGRRIAITATNDGYSPASVDVKKGEAVVLVFTRKTPSECLAQIVIPDLNIKKDLPVDVPVEIPVKFDKEGKVGFQCGMAMLKGTINVGS